MTEAVAGEPLTIHEQREGWARIETAYAYAGWIRADALGGDPDPHWLDQTAATPLDHAKTLLGAVYRWGGLTADGIDCSGLVHVSYRATGRLVPRDADQQEAAAIEVDEPQPGDLVSYGDNRGADHIAFWLGGGRILHATGRDGVRAVIDEPEPPELQARRRKFFRF